LELTCVLLLRLRRHGLSLISLFLRVPEIGTTFCQDIHQVRPMQLRNVQGSPFVVPSSFLRTRKATGGQGTGLGLDKTWRMRGTSPEKIRAKKFIASFLATKLLDAFAMHRTSIITGIPARREKGHSAPRARLSSALQHVFRIIVR
jgi:hypothetical protein